MHIRETWIYSVLSFPRRREPSQVKQLDPRLRGDDELIRDALIIPGKQPALLAEVEGIAARRMSCKKHFSRWPDKRSWPCRLLFRPAVSLAAMLPQHFGHHFSFIVQRTSQGRFTTLVRGIDIRAVG